MAFNWKKSLLIIIDMVIAVYLVLAVTAFNRPDDHAVICNFVDIQIEQDVVEGFLTNDKIKDILNQHRMNPLTQPMHDINTRNIEDLLESNNLVEQVECYKTTTGRVYIAIKQRIPILHVMADNGETYYVDSHCTIIPQHKYTSNSLVATGHISKSYAQRVLAPMVNTVLTDKFWKNQIVQINVLQDGSIELVPRVGEHIAYLGQPVNIVHKLERLRKFYKLGLSQAGWNKYSRISVEFDNQIICTRRAKTRK
jgi:cell division protein FtsQ